MATQIAELTLAEECYSRAEAAGFSKRGLTGLKRTLTKRSDGEILAAISGLCSVDGSSMEAAIGLLYSLTEQQLADLEWKLKTSAGWD